ncbi:MAG: hypothetical protein EZS28_022091, partial [Streblomastix strix]
MAREMKYAKIALLTEQHSETENLRKQAIDLQNSKQDQSDNKNTEQCNEKQSNCVISSVTDQPTTSNTSDNTAQQTLVEQTQLIQPQDELDLNNPNFGIINIDNRRYNVNNELINQGLKFRENPDYYLKMIKAAEMYLQNDPRYFVHGHLASVRDIAFHPQLMLLASVSDDGTAALTDVSHAGKHTQKETSARQQGKSQTDIKYNQQRPLCVKFLPYLESSNDKQRKQLENQITRSSSSKGSQSNSKRMAYDLGCFVIGDNNGKITVYALPDPNMQMDDTLNKYEKNKMFEIDAHSDAVWSIDESSQPNGLFNGTLLPHSGSKLIQTRIVSASADGTVKLWNINTDGIPDQLERRENVYHHMLSKYQHTPSIASSVVINWDQQRSRADISDQNKYFKPIEQIKDKWEDSDIPTQVIFDPMNVANIIVGYVSGDLVRYDIEKGEYNWNRIGKLNRSERIISLTKSLTATHYQTQNNMPLLVTTNHGYLHIVDTKELQTIISFKASKKEIPKREITTIVYNQAAQQKSQHQQQLPQQDSHHENQQSGFNNQSLKQDESQVNLESNVLTLPGNAVEGQSIHKKDLSPQREST